LPQLEKTPQNWKRTVFPHTFRVVHRSRKPLKLQFLQLRVLRVFEGAPWLVGGVLRGWAARHARRVDGDDTDRGPKFQSGGSPPSRAQVAPREVSSASFRVAHKEKGVGNIEFLAAKCWWRGLWLQLDQGPIRGQPCCRWPW
jgi:hypothetical protein